MIMRRLALAAVVLAGFFPFWFLLGPRDTFIMLDCVAVAVGLGVLWAYGRGTWAGIKAPLMTAPAMLIFGIFVTWLSLGTRILWMGGTRLDAEPSPVFLNHWVLAYTVYLAIIGGSLHLLANRAIEDQIPPSGWLTLLISITVGLLVGIVLIAAI
jgi:hypothetical protein